MVGPMKIGAYALVGLVAIKGLSMVPDAADPGASLFLTAAEAAEPGPEPTPEEEPAEAPEEIGTANPALPVSEGMPELLAAVAAEQEALAAKAAELDLREAEIELARSAVLEQNRQLAALREEVAGLLERAEGNHAADVGQLVNIYKAMSPEEAAEIMNEADLELSVLVISAMEERSSGPVMAEMDPARARAISRIILERSRLPGDRSPVVVQID